MSLNFEWNVEKANTNLKKHGISFDEAKTVFYDNLALTLNDTEHSIDENRLIEIGLSNRNRLLVVVYTEREDNVRIISSRIATKMEMKFYENNF
jgi:uncharacterized DUF497 family protein